MMHPLYVHIARTLGLLEQSEKHEDIRVAEKLKHRAEDKLRAMEAELPHGSGYNTDTKVSPLSSSKKIILFGTYWPMKDGVPQPTIDFRLIIRPSLGWGYTISCVGGDQYFKEMTIDIFDEALRRNFLVEHFNEKAGV